MFGKCCSKTLEEKFGESFKQVQTLSAKPIVVKQYQYGASCEGISCIKGECTQECTEVVGETLELKDFDKRLRPRSKRS